MKIKKLIIVFCIITLFNSFSICSIASSVEKNSTNSNVSEEAIFDTVVQPAVLTRSNFSTSQNKGTSYKK